MERLSIVEIKTGRSLGQFRREIVRESANAIYLVQDAEFKEAGVKTHMITEFDASKFRLERVDSVYTNDDKMEERSKDPYAT